MSMPRLAAWLSTFLIAVMVLAVLGGSQSAYAATYPVTNTNDSGVGSLRQALISANNNAGIDTVTFNIPGSGPHVISPLTTYSSADGSQLGSGIDGSNAVIIDGCTQPGSDCSKFPLTLKVQVDGVNLPTAAAAAIFNPGGINSIVKGLSVTDSRPTPTYAAFSAIRISSGGHFVCLGGLTLQSNFFGLAPDGSAKGLTSTIVPCTNGAIAFPSRIGGPSPGQGNVIGAISSYGIATNSPIFGAGSTNNWVIEGNYFGLDPTGTQARPIGDGIGTVNAAITISGAYTDPTTGVLGVIIRNNKIANSIYGIYMYSSSGALIEDNEITGSTLAGIYVTGLPKTTNGTGFPPNVVQTPLSVQDNTITGTTGGPGIAVVTSGTTGIPTRVTMQRNDMYGNSGLGIDLGNNGVTANGPAGVTRSGPNTLLNYPVLTRVERETLRAMGTYTGMPNQAYTLDFYGSPTADASGHGEGQQWLGSGMVTTDGAGSGIFTIDLSGTLPTGWVVSATATDGSGNTSEFSQDMTAAPILLDSSKQMTTGTSLIANVLPNVLSNDTPIDPASLRLIDPNSGNEVTDVVIPAEGEYTANPDGTITFVPAAGFVGTSSVQYVLYDTNGTVSNATTLAVAVSSAPLSPSSPSSGSTSERGSRDSLADTGENMFEVMLIAVSMIAVGSVITVKELVRYCAGSTAN